MEGFYLPAGRDADGSAGGRAHVQPVAGGAPGAGAAERQSRGQRREAREPHAVGQEHGRRGDPSASAPLA